MTVLDWPTTIARAANHENISQFIGFCLKVVCRNPGIYRGGMISNASLKVTVAEASQGNSLEAAAALRISSITPRDGY